MLYVNSLGERLRKDFEEVHQIVNPPTVPAIHVACQSDDHEGRAGHPDGVSATSVGEQPRVLVRATQSEIDMAKAARALSPSGLPAELQARVQLGVRFQTPPGGLTTEVQHGVLYNRIRAIESQLAQLLPLPPPVLPSTVPATRLLPAPVVTAASTSMLGLLSTPAASSAFQPVVQSVVQPVVQPAIEMTPSFIVPTSGHDPAPPSGSVTPAKRRAEDAADSGSAKRRRAVSDASSEFSSYDMVVPQLVVAPAGVKVTEQGLGAAQQWLAAQCFDRVRSKDSQIVRDLLGALPTQGGYVVPDATLESLRAALPLVPEAKVLRKSERAWTLLVYGHNDQVGRKFTPFIGLEAAHSRSALNVPSTTEALGKQCTAQFGHRPSKMGVCTFCGVYASNASTLCNHIRNTHWRFSVTCMRCGHTTTAPADWTACFNSGSGRKGFLEAHNIVPADFGPFNDVLVRSWFSQTVAQDEGEVTPNSYILSKRK